jgi:hypothetical protein
VSLPSSAELETLGGGRFTLLRKIGQGSQGETYEARANELTPKRPEAGALVDEWKRYVSRAQRGETPRAHGLVAIKRFHVATAKSWKDVELAEREATTLKSLAHPNLPKYVEHFEDAGALYLVMEMVEGESLAALRARKQISSTAEVARMVRDIGDALRYLHGRAPCVVHRDIKPGNIIRRPDGSYALVDFGAVRDRLKPEGGSTVVGTFGYMAPEQFQGRASPKSDLYGLAATALVMLTGREPEDLPHVGLGIDVENAVPRGTSRPLVRALASMLAADPDRRVSSIDDALALLDDVRSESPRKPPPGKREGKRDSKRDGTREAKRDAKRVTKREAAEAKRRRRAAARARRAPFVPRLVGQLLLFVALVVVWATVGFAVPLVLTILSLVFGGSLRRAALACARAAKRSQAFLGRQSAWLSGHRDESAATERAATEPARVRVGDEPDRLRVGDHDDEGWDDEAEDEEVKRRRSRRS